MPSVSSSSTRQSYHNNMEGAFARMFPHHGVVMGSPPFASNSGSSGGGTSRTLSLDQEMQGLLNYDEFLALWYFALAVWYGYLAFQNWKRKMEQRQLYYRQLYQQETALEAPFQQHQSMFNKIHWFIWSISIMGMANFLFSVSLLEVLNHRSGIGGFVKKVSYANMILACLRHPCTLSLGVLAPSIIFADNVVVPWLGPGGIRLPSGTKRTAMCLAALSCAQVVVRLTENLLILFRYGRRDTSSVRLADFFEFVLDGVFLAWMTLNLYSATRQISRDYGGRLAWWRTHQIVYFWILYSIFVVVSSIQSLVGILHYVISIATLSEHFVYTFYKVTGVNDLMLLSGIAILLRPTHRGQSYDSPSGDEVYTSMVDSQAVDDTTDYALLLPSGSYDNILGGGVSEESSISFEMSAARSAEPAPTDSLMQQPT